MGAVLMGDGGITKFIFLKPSFVEDCASCGSGKLPLHVRFGNSREYPFVGVGMRNLLSFFLFQIDFIVILVYQIIQVNL